jgi:hypothetical protein
MLPLPSDLAQIVDTMHPFTGTWAIAGGWAIDLWLGRQTRSHADVDIAVFRDEQSLLRATFADWQFSKVVDGKLLSWPRGEVLRLPEHEIHASMRGNSGPSNGRMVAPRVNRYGTQRTAPSGGKESVVNEVRMRSDVRGITGQASSASRRRPSSSA